MDACVLIFRQQSPFKTGKKNYLGPFEVKMVLALRIERARERWLQKMRKEKEGRSQKKGIRD